MNGLLLGLLILVFEFAPAEYYSWPVIVAAGLLVLSKRPKFFMSRQNPAVPLLAVLLCGIVFSFSHPTAAVLKDIWYVTKPIAIISLGLMLASLFKANTRWISNMSTVVIFISLANIGTAIAVGQTELGVLRPTSYFAAFMAPFIVKYYPRRSLGSLALRVVVMFLIITMIILSESRATLLTFAVGFLAAYGALQKGGRALFILGFVAFVVTVFFPLLPQYDFQGARYLAKLQNSINEVMFETGQTRLDMYRNWRGFEAFQAYTMWLEALIPQKIFGLGHGAEINLGRLVTFNEEDVESLHSIHNSYFALLVKTGALGVVAFLVFMIRPFSKQLRPQSADLEMYSRIVRGGALVFLLTSALVSGPLNKTSLDGLLILWSAAYGFLLLKTASLRTARRSSRAGHFAMLGPAERTVVRTQ